MFAGVKKGCIFALRKRKEAVVHLELTFLPCRAKARPNTGLPNYFKISFGTLEMFSTFALRNERGGRFLKGWPERLRGKGCCLQDLFPGEKPVKRGEKK